MQSFTVITAGTTLAASLAPLLANDETALSNSSGTAFPTTNLYIGMLCYRTDTNKLYELTGTGPSVWTLVTDLNKTPVETDGSGNATITGLFTTATLNAGATTITALLTAASASITGTLAVGGVLSTTAAVNFAKGADIASATTTNIGAASGNYINITGTTTITGFDTVQAGTERLVNFTGALTLTYNATNMLLPGAASIKTGAGDKARFISLGSGNWTCVEYSRANGQLLSALGAEATIASATATDLGSTGSNQVVVTGTTTITGFGSTASVANPLYVVRFAGALTLTYDATAMLLPGATNIKTGAGDCAIMLYAGSGNWRCLDFIKASGQVISATGAETSLASGTVCDLGTAGSNVVNITGTTTIGGFGSAASVLNPIYYIRFAGALTLTYNATTLQLPGAASITTAAGDSGVMEYLGSGNWKCIVYQKASGAAVVAVGGTNYQVFTANGTWNKPSGVTANSITHVQGWGGGGGGQSNGDHGGGGGSYVDFWFPTSSLGSTESVVVGAGGGVNSNANGGDSSFGSWLTAPGGLFAGQSLINGLVVPGFSGGDASGTGKGSVWGGAGGRGGIAAGSTTIFGGAATVAPGGGADEFIGNGARGEIRVTTFL